MITTMLFDFDGTLADSFVQMVAASNRMLRERNHPEISPEECEDFRSLTFAQIVKRMHLSMFAVPRLLLRMRAELREHALDIPPVEGMAEVVRELAGKGLRLGIVSSNDRDNVCGFLQRHGMDCFTFGSYAAGLRSKARNIRRLLRDERLDPSATIYVGDTVQDIEASHAAGIRVAAVTWGYAARQLLERAHPDWMVDAPRRLLNLPVNDPVAD